MKKLVAAVVMTMFAASMSFAADVTFKAKNGDVTVPAAKHQGVKIPEKFQNKDEAHKLCKGCHETKKKGPTKCGECHKKK